MLRMGWLCQSPYEWSQHARIAKASVGMSDAEIHAIAEGPSSAGLVDIDRAVLTMADELRYDAIISDATWANLRKTYSNQQVMELLFTSAQYQLVSMALNTLGIQIEPQAVDFIPKDVTLPATAMRPSAPRLGAPRIPAIEPADWTSEQRALVAPQTRADGTVFNLYKTLINHPKLYTPARPLRLLPSARQPPRPRNARTRHPAHGLEHPHEPTNGLITTKARGLRASAKPRSPRSPPGRPPLAGRRASAPSFSRQTSFAAKRSSRMQLGPNLRTITASRSGSRSSTPSAAIR